MITMAATGPDNTRCLGHYKIQTPEELQLRVDAYFDAQDHHETRALVGTGQFAEIRTFPDPQPYTWIGLARAIGLGGRQSLINYSTRDEFAPILRQARLRIEEQWEAKLQRLGNNNGIVFALTNNTVAEDRYVQKTEQDINLGGQAGNPVQLVAATLDKLSEHDLERIEGIMLEAGVDEESAK